MLRVEGLSKSFKDVKAVRDLSFRIDGGHILGLIGPNGAGKTTAIKCIATLLRPDAGKVVIDGHDISEEPEEAKRGFAYVPEIPTPYPMLSVEEHVKFVARAFSLQGWEPKADKMIRRFELDEKRSEMTKHLSKGQKQKVSLICAFIHDPVTILLDEPLIGIDPKGGRYLKDLIREAKGRGASILVSSHMLDLVEEVSTHLLIMAKGKSLVQGTISSVKKRARTTKSSSLEDIFLTITEGK